MTNSHLIRAFAAAIISGALLGCATSPAVESTGERAQIGDLENYLMDIVESGSALPPGISLAVFSRDATIYESGVGLADPFEWRVASPDTVYNTWSMTKPFTAMAVFQLVERGLLDLDTEVAEILDFFYVDYPSSASEPITVRHLLNHSSGLENNVPEVVGWVHTDGGREWNQTELLRDRLPSYAKLAYEPGSEGRYTNVGYMVLAAIVEAVSGDAYEDYIMEHILSPLGMHHSGFAYTDSMIELEATGSHPRFNIITMLMPFLVDDLGSLIREKRDGAIWFNHVYSDQNGPTGLISSASDVSIFVKAIMGGGAIEGKRVLSESSVKMMLNESWVEAGKTPETSRFDFVQHGLGWFIVDDGPYRYLGHNGGGPGFATGMRIYPDLDLGMVVMANGTNLPTDDVLDLVASIPWR